MSAGRTVMVVDDDEALRESVGELLEDDGYRTVCVGSAATALQRLKTEPRKPDVILLDLMMPGMNGWQFREEQLRDPDLASIPVVVMTASREIQGIQVDEVLYKPVKLEKLLNVVRRRSSRGESSAPPALKEALRSKPSESPRESANPYALFMLAPAPIAVLAGDNLVFEMANERYLELCGRRDIVGKPLEEAIPEFKRPGFDVLRNAMKTGEAFVGDEMLLWLDRSGSGQFEETYWTFVYAPLQASDGAADRVMAFCYEVTEQVIARRMIEKSEERFRSIVTQIQAGIIQTDLEGRYVLANDRFREIVGRSEAELEQVRILDITHPDDSARSKAQLAKLIAGGVPFIIEKRYVRPDGSIVWVQNSVSRIDDAEGRPKGIAAVAIDITQRKYAEQALRESEERARRSLSNEQVARIEAESLYSVTSSISEAKLDVDALVRRLTEHATEIVGATFGAFEESFSGTSAVRLDDVGSDPRYEEVSRRYGAKSYLAVPVVSRNGEVFGGLFFGHPQPGRFTEQHERMVVAIAAHASLAMESAQLYRAARDNEARFRTIFETAPVSIWEKDYSSVKRLVESLAAEHGSGLRDFLEANPEVVEQATRLVRIRDVNPATLTMLRASKKEELSLQSIFLPETNRVFIDELIAIAEGRRLFAAEARLRRLSGEPFDVLFTVSFPPRDASFDRVLLTLVDISDRKAVETEREARLSEVERALNFSDTFVGVLGHDLRNPLNAIVMASEILLRRETNERVVVPIERILTSAERMTRMIEQILDFTRARIGGGIPIEPRPVDLHDLAVGLVDELEGAAQRTIILESTGDVRGEWDGDRLAQVISNLLGNAVEHGDPVQPIRLKLDGTAPDTVRISVWNAGAIPADVVPLLFDPLRAATTKKTQARKSRGLGLGLYIVQQVIHSHGGAIDVRSSEDAGTTMSVAIPRKAPRGQGSRPASWL